MANAIVKLEFHSSDKGPEGEVIPLPPGALKVRVQERKGTVGQDEKGNDTILYTWQDVGEHRAAQSGVHTELSKKQRLIVEVAGDI